MSQSTFQQVAAKTEDRIALELSAVGGMSPSPQDADRLHVRWPRHHKNFAQALQEFDKTPIV